MPPGSVSLSFFVHLSRCLNPGFQEPENKAKQRRHREARYFSPDEGAGISRKASECYLPTFEILLKWLDQGGKLSFCITGTAIDLFDLYAGEVSELLGQIAAHKNAEVLGKTYYNSIAALFENTSEYREQVETLNRTLAQRFHAKPACIQVDWFLIRPHIIPLIQEMGFQSLFITGIESPAAHQQPAGVFMHQGIPSVVAHCTLADDIAARFNAKQWDKYPLTAERYTRWISETSYNCVPIQFDTGIFGHHHKKETGIFDFLKNLPEEMESRGLELVTVSEAAARYSGDLSPLLPEPPAASGVHLGHGLMMNMEQFTAFSAVQDAARTIKNSMAFRHLQAVDHFRAMSMRSGWCGHPPRHLSHQEAHQAFSIFMCILSDLEEQTSPLIRHKKALRALRPIPPDKAFHFSFHNRYAGFSAHSLAEFLEMIQFAPDEVIGFHQAQGDFARWISEVLKDAILAREVQECRDRNCLTACVSQRLEQLKRRLE